MKGAKGGNRDRIISWLFSEKTRKLHEENNIIPEEKKKKEEELNKKENKKRQEKKKEQTTPVKTEEINDDKTKQKEQEKSEEIVNEDYIQPIKEKAEEIADENYIQHIKEEPEILEIDNNLDQTTKTQTEVTTTTTSSDTSSEIIEIIDGEKESIIPPPTLFIDEEIVEEIKELNQQKEKEENESINEIFPEVPEVNTIEIKDNVEKPELLQVSIIEEIDELLRNDQYDLQDIKYQIEILDKKEKDEVLLENIEKIRKELDDLIKRFNEIKKKYDYSYSTISIKEIDIINSNGLDLSLSDYINNSKEGLDTSTTLNQIKEIEEFIDIMNNIIDIEKQKDLLEESVDNKLVDFNIRDEDFIKLQDQYTDVEKVNSLIEDYNRHIDSILSDMESKIKDNTRVTETLERTTRLVPNLNRIMEATVLMASTSLIPRTPGGNLFRATLFATAAHMMATSLNVETEERKVTTTTVTDYSRDILNNKQDIKDVLGNIENAFDEINYMKDVFDKEFSQYKSQIPEYDTLVKNIFSIEKELSRQQVIALDYDNKIDKALDLNNQKVKVLEN